MKTPHERLMEKIEYVGDCWIWRGYVSERGYGHFSWRVGQGRYRTRLVHRVAYLLYVGEILEGHEVHHTCENKTCCNPEHLISKEHGAHMREHRKKLCKRGHPLSGENLRISPEGRRSCKECGRMHSREAWRRFHPPSLPIR